MTVGLEKLEFRLDDLHIIDVYNDYRDFRGPDGMSEDDLCLFRRRLNLSPNARDMLSLMGLHRRMVTIRKNTKWLRDHDEKYFLQWQDRQGS